MYNKASFTLTRRLDFLHQASKYQNYTLSIFRSHPKPGVRKIDKVTLTVNGMKMALFAN
jgi:hypothetical protein